MNSESDFSFVRWPHFDPFPSPSKPEASNIGKRKIIRTFVWQSIKLHPNDLKGILLAMKWVQIQFISPEHGSGRDLMMSKA